MESAGMSATLWHTAKLDKGNNSVIPLLTYLCHTTSAPDINRNESWHAIHAVACLDDIGSIENGTTQQLVLHQSLRHDRVAQQITHNVWNAASQICNCLGIV